MKPVTIVEGLSVSYPESNVDTDQIVPARYLHRPRREGYGDVLFHDLRFDENGTERPDFMLNRPDCRNAILLVTGANFGCGSSREHAVWALMDYGIRSVIAPSFGDIFYSNALKNGLLPIVLDTETLRDFQDFLPTWMAVDLKRQQVTGPDGRPYLFDIAPFVRHRLLKGIGEIDLTLKREGEIAEFEARHRNRVPWVFRISAGKPGGTR